MDPKAPKSTTVRQGAALALAALLLLLTGTATALPGKNRVDSGDIARGQVMSADLAAGAVTEPKLATGAVTGAKLATGAVTAAKIAGGAVTGAKLATGSVSGRKLASGAVTSAKVAANALTGADIDESSLSLPSSGGGSPSGAAGGDLSGQYPDPQVLETGLAAGGDLSGSLAAAQVDPAGIAASGDVAGSLDATEIAAGAVGGPEIASGAVADAELADVTRTITISADQVGEAGLMNADRAIATRAGDFPALGFTQSDNNTLNLLLTVPDDRAADSPMDVTLLWSANAAGDVVWRTDFLAVTPSSGELVNAAPGGGSSQTATVPVGANHTLRETGFDDLIPAEPTVSDGDAVALKIVRLGTDAGDTLGANALLHLVRIAYTAEG